ncbi:MAG: CapA family protein [Treponema sp.]|nr:CapA family protein [Candidatus Treponema caballi]
MKKTALFSLLFVFVLTSCSPVVYEIGADADIYSQMEAQTFFQFFPEAKGYEDARVIHSEKDFSLVLVNGTDGNGSTTVSKNVFARFGSLISGEKTFHLADITLSSSGQQSLKDGAVSVAKAFGTLALDEGEMELSRLYMYPCIPFAENLPFEAYSPNAMGNGSFASAADCAFYELEDIPDGMVILPVQLGDVQYLAGDADYPLYESTFARVGKYRLPAQKKDGKEAGGAVIRTAEDAYNAIEAQESGTKLADDLYGYYDEAVSALDAFFADRVSSLANAPVMPKTFFVAGVGDLLMSRGSDWAMINVDSPGPVFQDTIPILKNSAITIGNLEGPVTTSSTSIEKSFVFKFRPEVLKYLRQAGFNYLRLNNTHSWDYGETGFNDTLKAFNDSGFATSGAGKNIEEASRFYRTSISGYPVSILSVAASHIDPYNINRRISQASETKAGILWETDMLPDLIREEKKNGSIIIINVHGGAEYSSVPTADQQLMYRKLCDAGADVVFGSHPHVLQPVEWYNDSLIVWSLGNFMYPGMEDIAGTAAGMIVRAGFVNGRLLYYEKHLTRNVGTTVRLVK